ncbi:hypothetical protein AX15_004126 [Amanita polypyramis BW_CC]|nr:hypothetical protein AX15_004126 [Amanita polypyramis BW_CC]
MIHSAQVFSPRPSQNPRENLRVLQSPLKGGFRSPLKLSRLSYGSSPTRISSPTKPSLDYAPQQPLVGVKEEEEDDDDDEGDDDDDDEDIVLVEGDHPRVVEEEKDLVILEDVELFPASSNPTSPFSQSSGVPYQMQFSMSQPPQTPPRPRSNSRNNLHRSVLIRSAQRTVLRVEKEREDEMEEMEVFSVVASDNDFELNGDDEHGRRLDSGEDVEQDDDNDIVVDMGDWEAPEDQEVELRGRHILGTMQGKNSEHIWLQQGPSSGLAVHEKQVCPIAFAARSQITYDVKTIRTDHDDETPKQHERRPCSFLSDSQSDGENEEDELHSNEVATESHSIRKIGRFGTFMTPQPSRRLYQGSQPLRRNIFYPQKDRNSGKALASLNNSTPTESGSMRYSIGGGEPRRMLVEMPWRVKDLVVPLKAKQRRQVPATSEPSDPAGVSISAPRMPQYSTPKPGRRLIDEQERKVINLTYGGVARRLNIEFSLNQAIQERRRSALHQTETFFIGGIPGMGVSPTKGTTAQSKRDEDSSVTPQQLLNPFRENDQAMQEDHPALLSSRDNPGTTGVKKEEEDDEVDTRSLLEKMRVTVEEMKRRRSTILTPQLISELSSAGGAKDKGSQIEDGQGGQLLRLEDATQRQIFPLLHLDTSRRSEGPVDEQDIGTGTIIPEVGIDSSPEADCGPVEKSFSQLMRPESPEDVEKSSDDIRDILEQDIAIPSDSTIEPPGHPVSLDGATYPIRRSTQSRCPTASVESEVALPSPGDHTISGYTDLAEYDDIGINPIGETRNHSDEESTEQNGIDLKVKKREQRTPITSQVAGQVEEPEVENEKRVNSKNIEVAPAVGMMPAPRVKRGRPLRTARVPGPPRRGRTMATDKNKNQETFSDTGEESLATINRQTRATATRKIQIMASRGKGRPQKVKEELEMTAVPVITRSSRARSATITGEGSNTVAMEKTPVTRASAKKTPATAPSTLPVVDAQDGKEKGGKENSRRPKALPEEGVRVKVTRSRKVANNNSVATASKSTAPVRIKDEDVEDNPPRRAARTRTRTKI